MKSRPLPQKIILVCTGGSCRDNGCKKVIRAIEAHLDAHELWGEVRLQRTCCMGRCSSGPNVMVYPRGAMCSKVKRKHVAALINGDCGEEATPPDPAESPHPPA